MSVRGVAKFQPQTPALSTTNWAADAACAEMPHDDFFYEGRFVKNSREQVKHREWLRKICARCPVFGECRTEGDVRHDVHGFRAGETVDERKARWAAEYRKAGK